jgi:glycosyltransferase involved in cell wall biosynthesis
MIRAAHQFLPGFVYGDAIGNHALELRAILRALGFASNIYAEYIDPRLRHEAQPYQQYRGQADHLALLHFSIGSPLNDFVRQLPNRQAVYYHNITPAHFFRVINPAFAQQLALGREQLPLFRAVPWALAASSYNASELQTLGFQNVQVIPYILNIERLRASAFSEAGEAWMRRYHDGATNLVFIGRLVPNKQQLDLLRLFGYFHRLVEPHSRLLFVGSAANAESYLRELQAAAWRGQIHNAVEFCGPVGLQEGLGAFYRLASAFVCLSEHEGFCVPLVEAMHFSVPVMAYLASGVPGTLGAAGLQIKQKNYAVMAETLGHLLRQPTLRNQIVNGQTRRLAAFERPQLEAQFREWIQVAVQ